ncbi:MAG: DEAD/DEAH box helicase [bacterium]|nr:DEAD/DEAH box helicase [bacterium]
MSEILDELFKDDPFLQIKGSTYLLTPQDKEKLLRLGSFYDKKTRKIQLSRLHVGALEQLEDIVDQSKLDESWKKAIHAIQSFTSLKEAPLPKIFNAQLRPYQQEGVNWLSFLKEFQFGGILADDMGLGKTIQALSILAHSHENPKINNPSLIVAPTSVIYNWKEEIQRFTPNLNTYLYIGKERIFPKDKSTQVIITSYALLWRERELFTKHRFHYVILDEAHYIKNHKSQTAKTAYQLSADYRLSLTGTPLENNLTELWSQCSFINPGLFSNLENFKETFVTPIEKYQNMEAKERLRYLIKPFLLRRLKQNVIKELPPKIEQTLWCEMSSKQRTLYNAIKQYYQAKLLKIVNQKGIKKSQIEILEALLRLRQICCHPDLLQLENRKSYSFLPSSLRNIHESIKLESVIELIQTAVAEKHKVLLFSQFVSMLEILRSELDKAKIPYLILTGKTQNRQEIIKQFQNESTHSVFLLSLKAGGTGINLTAADYVIHYDPWWNPAVEVQATDRTHRIGQTKSVSVYKILIKDSIEEKIQALQEKKKGLIEDIIGGISHGKGLTKEDLAYLFE